MINYIKNSWITSSSIGLRKLILFYLITYLIPSLYFLFIGNYIFLLLITILAINTIIFFCKQIYIYGLIHRVDNFSLAGERIEIIDIIKPFHKEENIRKMIYSDRNRIISGIYTFPGKKDILSYDYCRLLAEVFFPINLTNVLILGGGGCSVPRYISRRYANVSQDVVEISPIMISMAKKYFLDLKTHSQIRFINSDAWKHVKNATKKYQFIFQDIVLRGKTPKYITDLRYLKRIKNLLTDDGIVIINVNGVFNKQLTQWKKIFRKVYILSYKGCTALFILNFIDTKQQLSGLKKDNNLKFIVEV